MTLVGDLITANSQAAPGSTIGEHLLSQAQAGVVEDRFYTRVLVTVDDEPLIVTVKD